jgi:tetratricopeptide (TPR) repeat protein
VLDPYEVHAVSAQRLQLAVGPPEVAPSEGRDEVRQVVPEPVQDLAEPFALLVGIRLRERGLRVGQDAALVDERLERSDMDLLERAFPSEEELALGTVRQDEEHDPIEVEVLDEQRLTEPIDERFPFGHDLLERFVHRDHADEAIKSTAAAYLARAVYELGRIEEAAPYTAIARAAAAEDDLMSQALARSVEALVRSARGEHAAAEMLASEAIHLFSDAECPNMHGDLRMDLATVLRAAGRPNDAMRVAREALLHYDRKGNRVSSQRVRTFLAELERSHL